MVGINFVRIKKKMKGGVSLFIPAAPEESIY